MALTPRKRAFADAVLAGKSNRDAAITAGYSERTASAAGSRLVKDPDIVEYLDKHRAAAEKGEPPPVAAPTFDLSKALQHNDPRAFLLAAMNDVELDPKQRVDAAKALLPYFHRKMEEMGKKEGQKDAAGKVGGRFSSPPPPPLRVVGGK